MTRRLAVVLRHDPEDFAALAAHHGWVELSARPAATAAGDAEGEAAPVRRWRVGDGELRLVDDLVVRQQRVEIDCAGEDAVSAAIEEEVTLYDRQTCLEVLDLTDAESTVCYALRMLTATAPGEADAGIVDAVRLALADPRETVRAFAFHVALATGWAEFHSDMQHAAADDHGNLVRRFLDAADLPGMEPPEQVAVHMILVDEAGRVEAPYGDQDLASRAGLMTLIIRDHLGTDHRTIQLAPETGLMGWERVDGPDGGQQNTTGTALLHALGAAQRWYTGPLAITAIEEPPGNYSPLTAVQFNTINAAVAAISQ